MESLVLRLVFENTKETGTGALWQTPVPCFEGTQSAPAESQVARLCHFSHFLAANLQTASTGVCFE